MHARRPLTAAATAASILVFGALDPPLADSQVAGGHQDETGIGATAVPAPPPPSPTPAASGSGSRGSGRVRGGANAGASSRSPSRPRTPPPPPANPRDLAGEAQQKTPLPVPTVGLSPAPPIPQLVNLPVFLWIDKAQWVPQKASATAGTVTSTVTATPKRVVWDMGNGDSVACDGPGAPYEPALSDEQQSSNCRYTYERGSAGAPGDSFTVTTTIEWDVEWVAVGAPGGGPLGTARRSSTTAVQVGEIQALNVPVR